MRGLTAQRRAIGLSVVAALLAASMIAGPAHAGTYKLYSCNVPGRAAPTPSVGPWRVILDNANTRYFDDCAAGGAFGIGLDPQHRDLAPGGVTALELRRPDVGPYAAIGIVRYRTWVTAELTGSGAPAFVEVGAGFSPPGGSHADGAPWVSGPFPATNPVVNILLYCATAGGSGCHLQSSRPLAVRGVETDLYESGMPSGSFDGGSLLSGGEQRGSRTVRYTAVDHESGVARVELMLGDTVTSIDDVEANAGACPHTDWAACPARYSSAFSVDTSRLAEGDHVATLRVTDAAGNMRVIRRSGTITISRSPAVSPPPTASSSVKTALATLSGQFAANARTTFTTSFGHAARVRGRLRDGNGKAIANATLAVREIPDGGGRSITKRVTTGPNGKYSYVASGARQSRRIIIGYPADSGAPAVVRRLRLRVRAAATLQVALRGVRVTYKGRVISRPIPRKGKRVFLEGRAKGGAWQRFAVRKTDSRGRFSGRYRLRVRRPGVRLQFRVVVPKQTGYPYTPRTGRALTRIVR